MTCMAAVRPHPITARRALPHETPSRRQCASVAADTCAMTQDRYVIEKLEETVKTFRELQVLPSAPRTPHNLVSTMDAEVDATSETT